MSKPMSNSTIRPLALLFGLVFLLVACAAPPSAQKAERARLADAAKAGNAGSSAGGPTTMPPEVVPAYTLQVGDEVDIRYGDSPAFDQTTRIRPDGFIGVPYIGSVRAAGLSPEALQADLQERHARLAHGSGERRYLLQPGDDIELKFANAPTMNDIVKVRPDGQLQLQLIGSIRASGRTPEELRDLLRTRYAQYLRKSELAVIVRTTTTQTVYIGDRPMRAGTEQLRPVVLVRSAQVQQVFVGGEVLRPGVLLYRPGLTLMQAAIEVGGRLPTADLTRVVVLRRQNDAPVVIERDLGGLLVPTAGKQIAAAAGQDVPLQPSDVVVFPQTKVAGVGELLNEYVFKNVPFIRNSSFGFSYLVGTSAIVK